MEKKLTDLDKGIFVYIDPIQLELLKGKPGFISKEAYPDHWTEISVDKEVGRFLIFRFLQM